MDDAALARAAQAGDAAGLGALFERHHARLHAIATGMLGHGPDAEDAVQDAILIALRRIGELRQPGAVGGWLAAILVNVCRAQRRRPARVLPFSEPGFDTVQDAIERAALRDWVWTALERLPESQRVAVMLRHFSRVSAYEEIAEICDVPVGTVRSRLNAARTRLAGELLATAAEAYTDRERVRGYALAAGGALAAFQRSGDTRLLDTAFAPDVAFRMADRVERRGRALLAAGLWRDFDDGVVAHPLRVIGGEHVAITELVLESPADQPLHCPPAVTQVHWHDAGRTHRLVSHYAPLNTGARRSAAA
ncbi:RNA polymerase sigma factor [Solirubrobacter soli]|uniref:RNA polymerase sigma factor n=1 Tax=Solirubrobacter soli TaxID=363832 RepID=UPI0004054F67|nr:sigma-70 family RNA polymerase sigma factor [Solirubrobacter soli]